MPPLFDFDIPQPGQREAAQGWAARLGKDTKDGMQTSLGHPERNHLSNPTCPFQNPEIPRASRVGAHGRVAGQGWAGLFATKRFP